ncbi:MAG: hypothetical protein Q9M89_03385 [Persephonella sp.]|nr:hypothetical protein [Persephonella sp.]
MIISSHMADNCWIEIDNTEITDKLSKHFLPFDTVIIKKNSNPDNIFIPPEKYRSFLRR